MKQPIKSKAQVQSETEYGDVYTREEFIELVARGLLLPYDGSGYFHDGIEETNRSVWEEDLSLLELRKYPYVMWYNI